MSSEKNQIFSFSLKIRAWGRVGGRLDEVHGEGWKGDLYTCKDKDLKKKENMKKKEKIKIKRANIYILYSTYYVPDCKVFYMY